MSTNQPNPDSAPHELIPANVLDEWAAQRPDGVDQEAWNGLLSQLQASGQLPIQSDKLAAMAQIMRDRQPPPKRHSREFGIPSIQQIQTPITQASASWADGVNFAERYDYREGEFWLGRSEECKNPLGVPVDDELHVLVCCKSRSGKGTGLIIPNHLLWQGPLISVDPKGENATNTAARRGDGNDVCMGMGQKVCVLDPLGEASVEDQYRACFNPLDELDPDDPETLAKSAAIAGALVRKTGKENEDYWLNETRGMLQALILHIITHRSFEGRRHLGTLRSLIIEGDVQSWKMFQELPGNDFKGNDASDVLFVMMMKNPAFKGEIAAAGRSLKNMRKEGKTQWIGVDGGMRTHTEWLRDERMIACLEHSDFRLSEFKGLSQGISVFLCLPERDMETYSRWQGLIINLAAYELQRTEYMPACGQRVFMCLDEFAGMKRLDQVERGFSYFAGNKVKLMVVLQGIYQVKHLYQETWESFIQNSSVKVFFDMDDDTTLDFVSKRMGEIELTRYVESQNAQVGAGSSVAAGKSKSTNKQRGSNKQKSKNEQVGVQRNWQENASEGVSDSTTDGRSSGKHHGGNRSKQEGESSSKGSSYDRFRWLRGIQEPIAILRDHEKRSLSDAKNRATTDGTSWGDNTSEQSSDSHAKNKQWNKGHGGGVQVSSGNQTGSGTNESSGEQEGLNLTGTASENISGSIGYRELFQKRPLAAPNDLRKWLHQIKDRSHPYFPGLALVMVGPDDPALIRRVNYYQDEYFDGLFDRNPSHPESDPPPVERTESFGIIGDEQGCLFEGGQPIIARWLRLPGDEVEKNTPILEVTPGPSFTGLADSTLLVMAPRTGVLSRSFVSPGQAFQFNVPLFEVEFHIRDHRRERHIDVIDEVSAYNDGKHPAYLEYAKLRTERDERLRLEAELRLLKEAEAERLRTEEEERRRLEEERRRREEEEHEAARLKREEEEREAAESALRQAERAFKRRYQWVPFAAAVLMFLTSLAVASVVFGVPLSPPKTRSGLVLRVVLAVACLLAPIGPGCLAGWLRKSLLAEAWLRKQSINDREYWHGDRKSIWFHLLNLDHDEVYKYGWVLWSFIAFIIAACLSGGPWFGGLIFTPVMFYVAKPLNWLVVSFVRFLARFE